MKIVLRPIRLKLLPRPVLAQNQHQLPTHLERLHRELPISFIVYGVKADQRVSQLVRQLRILLKLLPRQGADQILRDYTTHPVPHHPDRRSKLRRGFILPLIPYLLEYGNRRQDRRIRDHRPPNRRRSQSNLQGGLDQEIRGITKEIHPIRSSKGYLILHPVPSRRGVWQLSVMMPFVQKHTQIEIDYDKQRQKRDCELRLPDRRVSRHRLPQPMSRDYQILFPRIIERDIDRGNVNRANSKKGDRSMCLAV
jgi:hypothetical protein